MIEFEKVIDTIENCQTRYKEDFISYMQQRSADAQQRSADAQQRSADAQQRSADAQQRSADAQQRSADAQQRSADAQQRSADAQQRSADAQQRSADAIKSIMHTDSTRIKKYMEKFYDTYIQTPDIVKQEDIDFMRKSAKEIIASCKEY